MRRRMVMGDPVLNVASLSCRYPRADVNALEDIGFTVKSGEFLCITGKSGCGKSTLLRCIAGILPRIFHAQVTGEISLEPGVVADIPTWQIGAYAGVVLQNPDTQLLAHTPRDEIALALHHAGMSPSEIPARTRWALDTVDATQLGACPTRELSAGQKQRVVTATALAKRPNLLILDEPLSMLDPLGVAQMLDTLVALHRQYGVTILLFEHRVERILDVATRAIVLDAGRVAYDGVPASLRDPVFCRRYGLRNAAALRSTFEKSWPATRLPLSAVEAKELTYAYPGQRPVFERVSFAVSSGETLLVEGANGSGKSTLLRQFTGLLRPTYGQASLGGDDLAALSRPNLARRVGYVPQIPHHTFHQKTVRAELVKSRAVKRGGDAAQDIESVLAQCDLRHLAERHPLSLSGGEARRLAIATAVAKDPALVLLDEPTIGMDGERLAGFIELLARLQQGGTTFMLASNDIELLTLPFLNRLGLGSASAAPYQTRAAGAEPRFHAM